MRRIKKFGGQHQTLPIKDKKTLDNFLYYFLSKRDKAKTDVKYYQAYRDYMLVLIGLNTAFRAEDLLQLRVVDVIKGYVQIKENKTGKMQNFRMSKELHDPILKYIETFKLTTSDYLFISQMTIVDGKKYVYPITRQRGYKIVSRAAKAVGIDFVFGLHSLRKTFGYMYIKSGGKPDTLMKMLNHDDYTVTMRYVSWGVDDAESDRTAVFLGVKE